MDGRNYTPGKGGWSGREGQPPGSSEIVVRLTLEGATTVGGRPLISLDLRCPALGSHSSTNAGGRERPISDTEGDGAGDGIVRLPVSSPEMGDPTRGMRPAGAGASSPLQPVVALSNIRENVLVRPL